MLKNRFPLQLKYNITLLSLTVVLCIVFIAIFINISNEMTKQFNQAAQQQVADTLISQVRHQGRITSEILATQLSENSQIGQLSSLLKLADLVDQGLLSYTFIYDENKKLVGPYQQQPWPVGVPKMQYQTELIKDGIVNIFYPIKSADGEINHMLLLGLPFDKNQDTAVLKSNLTGSLEDSSTLFLIQVILASLVATLLALMVSNVISNSFARPIRQLATRSQRLGEGEYDINLAMTRQDEVGDLSRALQGMRDNLLHNYQQMTQLAWFDALTGLYNREGIIQQSTALLSQAQNQQVSMAAIDLDGFKKINDALGYQEGDETLKAFAVRLSKVVTKISHNALVARLSADEFVVIFCNEIAEKQSIALADQLLLLSQHALSTKQNAHQISLNIGIANSPLHGNDFHSLLKSANIAVHAAKNHGVNSYKIYNPNESQAEWDPEAIRIALSKAIKAEEPYVLYQGVFDQQHQLIGAEALVRWNHPKLGAVSPGKFIPIAEQFPSLIEELTFYVIERSCQAFTANLQDSREQFKVSINISASLLNNPELAESLLYCLSEYDISPTRFILEVTETKLLTDIDFCCQQLEKLRRAGFTLWIDDFGTGYSSLSYLHKLPVHGLKIDRSFVDGIDVSMQNQALIKAILDVSNTFNITTLAEGVETAEQQDMLIDLGCDLLQGFYLHKPANERNVKEFLHQSKLNQKRRMTNPH
ncbi:bifunctional diguanylate cyclase/phosphodiesterase [Motilimonas pumila]|uniref:Sensor domain-containing phosphodiesterase n=1 Tax=Motilimonas pumila TaxID=2303987 RepID=A0A418YBW6_9GAMM|nr:bifunctional diguanylate cyclase/phosphodiesterase [Motilimonas pumila]RJG41942.1 sensor domain-containing phosphodiesterase [Motilimonas pumila]